MPVMPRVNSKTAKIAFKILGVPPNLRSHQSPKKKKINRELVFQETIRVR